MATIGHQFTVTTSVGRQSLRRSINMEQALPTEGKQSVTRALITLLEAREKRGIQTYGRSLETFNGRDATQDAVEELVDAAQYVLQWQIERQEILGRVGMALAELSVVRRMLLNECGPSGTLENILSNVDYVIEQLQATAGPQKST